MTSTNPVSGGVSGKLLPHATANFSGIAAEILLGGESAPMTTMRMVVDPGQGAPQHISHDEDKVFVILSGHLLFNLGDDRIEATGGEILFVPRGMVHGFAAPGDRAEMVLVATPARHDRFFAAMDALPLPHIMDDVAAVCQQFRQTIVGPVITD